MPGTAFYLTPDRDTAPSALLHSLRPFRVQHEKVVLLTMETLRGPVALLTSDYYHLPRDRVVGLGYRMAA